MKEHGAQTGHEGKREHVILQPSSLALPCPVAQGVNYPELVTPNCFRKGKANRSRHHVFTATAAQVITDRSCQGAHVPQNALMEVWYMQCNLSFKPFFALFQVWDQLSWILSSPHGTMHFQKAFIQWHCYFPLSVLNTSSCISLSHLHFSSPHYIHDSQSSSHQLVHRVIFNFSVIFNQGT